MADLARCGTHGEVEARYVCEHIHSNEKSAAPKRMIILNRTTNHPSRFRPFGALPVKLLLLRRAISMRWSMLSHGFIQYVSLASKNIWSGMLPRKLADFFCWQVQSAGRKNS